MAEKTWILRSSAAVVALGLSVTGCSKAPQTGPTETASDSSASVSPTQNDQSPSEEPTTTDNTSAEPSESEQAGGGEFNVPGGGFSMNVQSPWKMRKLKPAGKAQAGQDPPVSYLLEVPENKMTKGVLEINIPSGGVDEHSHTVAVNKVTPLPELDTAKGGIDPASAGPAFLVDKIVKDPEGNYARRVYIGTQTEGMKKPEDSFVYYASRKANVVISFIQTAAKSGKAGLEELKQAKSPEMDAAIEILKSFKQH